MQHIYIPKEGKMDINPKMEAVRLGTGTGLAASYAYTLQDWVGIFTVVFLLLQILILLPKVYTTLGEFLHKWFGK